MRNDEDKPQHSKDRAAFPVTSDDGIKIAKLDQFLNSVGQMSPEGIHRRNLIFCITLLIAATVFTYWPVLNHEFINYDDPDYVTTNEVVQKGLTTEGVKWAFTTGHASNWHPVTWMSHMVDVSLFGMNPKGHHATNLFFHVINTILLLLLLRQMTGSVWRSSLVAALFALHPLHVESVAWVAERKDVLSAFFGLLTLMAYSHYVGVSKVSGPRSKVWYAAALVLFALGLTSKPMLVTWPFVMLLLDFWPLQRLQFSSLTSQTSTLKSLVREKLPFLFLTIASCIVTVYVQRGAMSNPEIIPLADRAINSVIAYAKYLEQTVWPSGLAVFYPFPIESTASSLVLPLIALTGLSWLWLKQVKARPFLLVGWCWFFGTLVPVIGLLQVGAQAHADRYSYLPLIGIFMMFSWGVGAFITRQNQRRSTRILVVASAVLLTVLSQLSRRQLGCWKNDRMLCAHATQVTEENYVAWGGLAIQDIKQENWASAMTNLSRAYEYAKPRHTERSVEYYIGVALQMQGKPLEALPYLEDCIISAEMQPERDHRLGLSLIEAGRLSEAEAAIKSSLAARPNTLNYILGLAALHTAKGDTTSAEAVHKDTILRFSNTPLAAKAYGDFLSQAKRPTEAVVQYAAAIKLKPEDLSYQRLYAKSLLQASRPDLAAAQYEKLFTSQKPTSEELIALADIYSQLERPQNASKCYDRLLAVDPDSISGLNNYAWLLATHKDKEIRNGRRAVELAKHACERTQWKAAILMGTLAAAYAEVGEFTNAIQTATKARDMAYKEKQDDVAKRNQELLELYSSGKPFHEN